MGERIKSASVDSIFTDPLYRKAWLEECNWHDLSRFARRALKPGGLLVTHAGVACLGRVIGALGSAGLT